MATSSVNSMILRAKERFSKKSSTKTTPTRRKRKIGYTWLASLMESQTSRRTLTATGVTRPWTCCRGRSTKKKNLMSITKNTRELKHRWNPYNCQKVSSQLVLHHPQQATPTSFRTSDCGTRPRAKPISLCLGTNSSSIQLPRNTQTFWYTHL